MTSCTSFWVVVVVLIQLKTCLAKDPAMCQRMLGKCMVSNPNFQSSIPKVGRTSSGMVFPDDLFQKTCKMNAIVISCENSTSRLLCPETAAAVKNAQMLSPEMCTETTLNGLSRLVPCMNDPDVQEPIMFAMTVFGIQTGGTSTLIKPGQKQKCSSTKALIKKMMATVQEKCDAKGVATMNAVNLALDEAMKGNNPLAQRLGKRCYQEIRKIWLIP